MNTPTPLRPRFTDYFGGCPVCWRNDGYRNVGRVHYYFCAKHRKKWTVGENLFSSWRSETEAIWHNNQSFLSAFELCESAYCDESGRANDIALRVPGVAERCNEIRRARAETLKHALYACVAES